MKYDINELQKKNYQNCYSYKSIVNIIKDLNDVENQVNKKNGTNNSVKLYLL